MSLAGLEAPEQPDDEDFSAYAGVRIATKADDDILRPPIKFKDAVGRKFSFPWHLCKTWNVGL